ncbi:hypothetical protein HU200_027494 [Digitaria exilis]|uniref:Trehalose 6-phosphate phosphatase n=1 Tax=Digitaria exilis TaxID=1010633 RepID=A0A835BX78_9POAL|nr:hypothetical protein HU200_027494 [Digitaria exilis]
MDCFNTIIQQANTKEISLFLDYDGTLAPIVSNPEAAYMSDEVRAVLQEVAVLFKTSVVSGRARGIKVSNFVKVKEINCAGSHGLDIKLASTTESASTKDHDSYQPAKEHLSMINKVYSTLLLATGDINGASVEHNMYCVSLHYRNVAKEVKSLSIYYDFF